MFAYIISSHFSSLFLSKHYCQTKEKDKRFHLSSPQFLWKMSQHFWIDEFLPWWTKFIHKRNMKNRCTNRTTIINKGKDHPCCCKVGLTVSWPIILYAIRKVLNWELTSKVNGIIFWPSILNVFHDNRGRLSPNVYCMSAVD